MAKSIKLGLDTRETRCQRKHPFPAPADVTAQLLKVCAGQETSGPMCKVWDEDAGSFDEPHGLISLTVSCKQAAAGKIQAPISFQRGKSHDIQFLGIYVS